MTIEERAAKAAENKKSMNCCQAVLLACGDLTGLDEASASAVGAGFGSGMGTMEGNCGALVGAVMAAGLAVKDRASSRNAAVAIQKDFLNRCGALDCHDLKGRETGVVLCACDDCCRNAIRALEAAGLGA